MPETEPEIFLENIYLQATLGIVDFCFFLWSVIGNSVVIYVIVRDEKLKSKANYLILSVASADLLIGLVAIPLSWYTVSFLSYVVHKFMLIFD